MAVPAAFFAVVLIWSTTPLAVKWSGEGPGFIFGAFGRMAFAAVLCLVIIHAMRAKLPWHREAVMSYIAASLGVYGAMVCVYWGAQFVPSGLIAVLFGLTPIVTSLMASFFLREKSITLAKITGSMLGLSGLVFIFNDALRGDNIGIEGVVAVLVSVLLHSASSVWVKRCNNSLSGFTVTSGALVVSVPLYFITWLMMDGAPPVDLNDRALFSIIYLSVIGSVLGFTLYFYILKNMEVNGAVLITLITPVLALILGNQINNEVINLNVWIGSVLVLFGLMMHQWGGKLGRRLVVLIQS